MGSVQIEIWKRFPSWRIRVLEAAESVGGTWNWNRYPGARVDSESLSYAFSFDEELMNEWHWKESFAPQSEILRYIERIAEKHDLNKDIRFQNRIKSARWQDYDGTWLFSGERGQQYQMTFFISCMGFLSTPSLPAIPGIESFKDFANKRIGVIGTGATGIQTITAVAKEPSVNSVSLPKDRELEKYDSIFQLCASTQGCFMHQADARKSLEVTEEERRALWEEVYAKPGFAKWLGVFSDTYTNREANKLYSDFMASKIRERINDPEVADSLIPKNHGFGTRRVPLESGYFGNL
ncbi:uncharacterized protein N7483_001082 [Penicillium malachiteum]|uniref:uncharacterized protein n=1 Tax=Penicillium malachiteum TaxID=1324776 RepID=UPI0025491A63|nr:uncharacterized protein N7483_001082 [Penicillium malachiteum]KAJ5735957.1 hypothetical protein N7483_001082 [Penicillium malachiteum]